MPEGFFNRFFRDIWFDLLSAEYQTERQLNKYFDQIKKDQLNRFDNLFNQKLYNKLSKKYNNKKSFDLIENVFNKNFKKQEDDDPELEFIIAISSVGLYGILNEHFRKTGRLGGLQGYREFDIPYDFVLDNDMIKFAEKYNLQLSNNIANAMSQEIKDAIIDEVKQGTSIPRIKTRIRRLHNLGHTVKVPPKIDGKGKVIRRGYKYKIPPNRYSEIIARSESIRWAGEGRLKSYERSGVVPSVRLETAGDKRVCPICSVMHGTEYTLQEAHGVLPIHCLCRCTMIPLLFIGGKQRVPGAKTNAGDLIITAAAIKLAIPDDKKRKARENIAEYNQEQRG